MNRGELISVINEISFIEEPKKKEILSLIEKVPDDKIEFFSDILNKYLLSLKEKVLLYKNKQKTNEKKAIKEVETIEESIDDNTNILINNL
jgi:uncharacterized protein Yka (UPF0111/DUF47 family)